MRSGIARYDGHADWYDETFSACLHAEEESFVTRLTEPEDLTLSFVTGYGTVGWAGRGSGDGSRIGGRVGFHHKTLASFLAAFAGAGLAIRAAREFSVPGHAVLPWDIGVVTEK